MRPPKTIQALLHWRLQTCPWRRITPEQLARSLSVENLPYRMIDKGFQPVVSKFRKLRKDARVRAAQRALEALM